MKFLKLISLFLVFIPLSCCRQELINISTLKENVIRYYESGEYEKDVTKAVKAAEEEFDEIKFDDSSVVIFDVDDTALSSYEINKELDMGYVVKLWDEWIDKANAPAIKPVKELYDYLLNKGSHIIFITGRNDKQYEPTKKNLINVGYTTFDTLITRQPNEKGLRAVDYKSEKRIALTNKGYKIAGTVGDQLGDLEGPYHGIQVKLPNYIYLTK